MSLANLMILAWTFVNDDEIYKLGGYTVKTLNFIVDLQVVSKTQ